VKDPKARRAILDQGTQGKALAFIMARMALMMVVLFTTIFLRQEVLGPETIQRMYAVIGASFLFSLVTVAFWQQTLRVRYFIQSQLLYDLLLTSYLVYLTGVSDSIFLFLYLLNIVFASATYQLHGALTMAALSGGAFAFIYYVNTDMDAVAAWYNLGWHELLFLLAAILCGQLMDELRRQKILLDSQRASIARLEVLNDRLLNSIPVGIIVVDQDEYVHKINSTALRLVRMAHPSALRLKYFELLPQIRGILGAWDQLTETQRLRFLFSHSDAVPAHLSLQIVPVTGEDQRPQHILVFQDMAKMMELEQKLEFESRLAATGELAAGIAHEIRNPLASISGCIELLAQHLRPENDQDRRLLDISLRETRRLNTLITDFLEFAKPKDHSSEIFPLRELVQEVADAVRAGDRGDSLTAELSIPGTIHAVANRERMKQVFFNLFLNSLEASPGQPVKITVGATAGGGSVQIDVKDDGSGIAPAVAERIFDPFFTTKASGTGLGLPTVAQILKSAKGEIQLLPSEKGAHFRLRLPSSATLDRNQGETGQ
jgi:two-component system, NtrC family, sensor histidine kinase PilS